ncbi:multiple sugar transport system permease protein [Alkalispirochaeta americana]|uniref:Multiple sugar transport system permease protein n=1 Tax=Alkalispirochaeta americana TaxID=159291 RepID=A0A1N6U3G4_9SPIO|nr:carbohydrate ABC transporter permease [Alkalispirochaeta americana]SIQ60077.1 multiple sugar transport system permease protein [Alkalispirochaeta americana]
MGEVQTKIKNYRLRRRLSYGGRLVILLGWLAVCVVPILILVMASLKPTNLFQTVPEILSFQGMTLENYSRALRGGNFFLYLRNSMIISLSALVVVLVVCTPMAYGITRLPSIRQKNIVVFSVLSTRFLPYVVLAMPMFMLFRQMGISGTLTGVILAHLAMQMPMIVWLMLGFFSGIPLEVEEAAVIDGCTPFQTFWRVSLPMVLPGLNASAILALIISYNEFLFAFFLAGRNTQPLTVGITRFVGGVDVGAQYGVVAAYGSLIIIPIILFALVANRYIVSGLTQGAVKG